MLVHPWDATQGDEEWRAFVEAQAFGQLIASGRGRDVPVVVPTQYVLEGGEVLLHLARPNPVWRAIDENSTVLLSVAGDWTFVPSAWKAIGDEDPALGIFDTPEGAAACTRRVRSDSPLQALILLNDTAFIHEHDHVSKVRCFRQIMSHEQRCLVQRGEDFFQILLQSGANERIERPERFIEQQKFGRKHQGAQQTN